MSLHPAPLASHGGGFFTWHAFDPACQAELWSTGFCLAQGTVLFDPIDWPEGSPLPSPPVWIVRTNENHDRNCASLAARTGASLGTFVEDFTAIPLPGAGEGETAHFHDPTGSLVVGDALIHLAPHGLMLLPDRYCTQPDRLRPSLQRLLDLPIQRIFFAHGDPILQDGKERIRRLLS